MLRKIGCVAALVLPFSFLIWYGIDKPVQAEESAEVIASVPQEEIKPSSTILTDIEDEEVEMVVEMKYNNIPLTEDEQILVRELCRVMEIDYRFAYALMWTESEFVWQVGDTSLNHPAIGYFQISTINAERLKTSYGLDIYDKYDNLEAGMRLLQELTEQFKDGYGDYDTETAVIMCYKCGINRGTELMDQGYVLDVVQTIKDKKADFDL